MPSKLESITTGCLLLDTHGVERMVSPLPPSRSAPTCKGRPCAALGLGQVTFMDFHRDAPTGPIYISLLVPVYAGGDRSRPLGVVVLRVDPAGIALSLPQPVAHRQQHRRDPAGAPGWE